MAPTTPNGVSKQKSRSSLPAWGGSSSLLHLQRGVNVVRADAGKLKASSNAAAPATPQLFEKETVSAVLDSQLDQVQQQRTVQNLSPSGETPPCLAAEASTLLSTLATHIELIASSSSSNSYQLPALLNSNFGNEALLLGLAAGFLLSSVVPTAKERRTRNGLLLCLVCLTLALFVAVIAMKILNASFIPPT